MCPMVCAASTTLNGLKNVSVSCSEGKTRYQQRGSGYAFQGRDRQGRAVTKTTAKALALGSSKPDLKHRKDNSVRTDLQRARLQVRNRAAQLTKSVFT